MYTPICMCMYVYIYIHTYTCIINNVIDNINNT